MIGGNFLFFCMHRLVMTTHPVKMRIKIFKDIHSLKQSEWINVSWKELKGQFKQEMRIKVF